MKTEFNARSYSEKRPVNRLSFVNRFSLTNNFFGSKLLISLSFFVAFLFYSSGCDNGTALPSDPPPIPITIEMKNAHTLPTNMWVEMDALWEVNSPNNLLAPGTSRIVKDKTVYANAQNEIYFYGFVDGFTPYLGYSVLTDKYNKLNNVHIYLKATFNGSNITCEETYTSD